MTIKFCADKVTAPTGGSYLSCLLTLSFKFTWLVDLRPTSAITTRVSSLPRRPGPGHCHCPCVCLGLLFLCHCHCHCCYSRAIIPLVDLVLAVAILLLSLTSLPCRPVAVSLCSSPLFSPRLVIATLDVSNRPHRPYHLLPSSPLNPPLLPPTFLFPPHPSPPTWVGGHGDVL